MISERDIYHVTEIPGHGTCLMVKIQEVPVPDFEGADGKTYDAVAAWGIHSKHPDAGTAEQVKRSLLVDMEDDLNRNEFWRSP